jgi:hypothetical protein
MPGLAKGFTSKGNGLLVLMLKLGPALVVILVGSNVKTRSCIDGHLETWFLSVH